MDTRTAIILAAGFGRRLDADEGHKILATVAGRPLLEYHLQNLRRLGVVRVIVVTGFDADSLHERIAGFEAPTHMDLCCTHNEAFEARNGLSVLAGVDALDGDEPFWVVMSDHLFEAALFDELAATWEIGHPPRLQGALVVDRKLDTIFDMPDATKVRTDPDDFGIGKHLKRFDAIDAGLFWCGPGFTDALRRERDACGDCSTSDAVRRLVASRSFGFIDIGEYYWQDVDTPQARAHAEYLVDEKFAEPRDTYDSGPSV